MMFPMIDHSSFSDCLIVRSTPPLPFSSPHLISPPPPKDSDQIASSAEIHPKAQVGQDSMVGEGSKIGDRTNVKRSVIGLHCTIGTNVRIVNSIIMDYVTIDDG